MTDKPTNPATNTTPYLNEQGQVEDSEGEKSTDAVTFPMNGWVPIWSLLNQFASGETQKLWARVGPSLVLGEAYGMLAILYQRQMKYIKDNAPVPWASTPPSEEGLWWFKNDYIKARIIEVYYDSRLNLSTTIQDKVWMVADINGRNPQFQGPLSPEE